MMAVSRLFGRKVPYNEAFRMRTLNFHKEILEALRLRDLRRAEQAMEQHLEDQDCMAH